MQHAAQRGHLSNWPAGRRESARVVRQVTHPTRKEQEWEGSPLRGPQVPELAGCCFGRRWVATVAGQFSRLDILVNCAAGNFLATAEELSQNGFKTGEDGTHVLAVASRLMDARADPPPSQSLVTPCPAIFRRVPRPLQ